MTPFKRFSLLTFIMPVAVLLTGCFTGIESTPKITAKHLNRENVKTTDEERLLADITYQPFSQWHKGKQFVVVDPKLEMALEPGSGAVPAAGSTILFDHAQPTPSVSGSYDTELYFTTPTSDTLIYRIAATPQELDQRSRVAIPFTIEASVVDSVRSRLKGMQLFIKTPTWYAPDGTHTIKGMKYIKVKIDDVVPGDLVYPARIMFTPDTASHVDKASIYIATDDVKGTRAFASLFSINDPRLQYPTITDHNWDNICRSRVEKFMTRDECRLALGAPNTVRNHNIITAIEEMWMYDNGIYLIFEDGILTSYRL